MLVDAMVFVLQHPQAVTFDGVARLAAKAAGKGQSPHLPSWSDATCAV